MDWFRGYRAPATETENSGRYSFVWTDFNRCFRAPLNRPEKRAATPGRDDACVPCKTAGGCAKQAVSSAMG
jgi:hypothetical protein